MAKLDGRVLARAPEEDFRACARCYRAPHVRRQERESDLVGS